MVIANSVYVNPAMDLYKNLTFKRIIGYKATLNLSLVPFSLKTLLAAEYMFNVAIPRAFTRPTVPWKSFLKSRSVAFGLSPF